MLAVVEVLVEVIMVLLVVMIVLEVGSHIIYYISGSGSGSSSSSVCFIILKMFSAYRKRSVHHTI